MVLISRSLAEMMGRNIGSFFDSLDAEFVSTASLSEWHPSWEIATRLNLKRTIS